MSRTVCRTNFGAMDISINTRTRRREEERGGSHRCTQIHPGKNRELYALLSVCIRVHLWFHLLSVVADCDACRVRIEMFRVGHRDDGVGIGVQAAGFIAHDAAALEELVHTDA